MDISELKEEDKISRVLTGLSITQFDDQTLPKKVEILNFKEIIL